MDVATARTLREQRPASGVGARSNAKCSGETEVMTLAVKPGIGDNTPTKVLRMLKKGKAAPIEVNGKPIESIEVREMQVMLIYTSPVSMDFLYFFYFFWYFLDFWSNVRVFGPGKVGIV